MDGDIGVVLAYLWVAVKVLTLGAIIYWGVVEARRFRRRFIERRGSDEAEPGEDIGEPGALARRAGRCAAPDVGPAASAAGEEDAPAGDGSADEGGPKAP